MALCCLWIDTGVLLNGINLDDEAESTTRGGRNRNGAFELIRATVCLGFWKSVTGWRFFKFKCFEMMVQNSCHVISDQIVTGGPLSLATVRWTRKKKIQHPLVWLTVTWSSPFGLIHSTSHTPLLSRVVCSLLTNQLSLSTLAHSPCLPEHE